MAKRDLEWIADRIKEQGDTLSGIEKEVTNTSADVRNLKESVNQGRTEQRETNAELFRQQREQGNQIAGLEARQKPSGSTAVKSSSENGSARKLVIVLSGIVTALVGAIVALVKIVGGN